jgi:hypothetical protein
MPPNFKGTLSISRTTSNVVDPYVKLEIRDGDARRVIRVEMTMEDFALALTGRSDVPCQGIIYQNGRMPKP